MTKETMDNCEEKTVELQGIDDYEKGIVIDASCVTSKELEDLMANLKTADRKIILTSVTIRELENMQKFRDIVAYDARHILAVAAENPDKFQAVIIDEKLETPDDCIIKYCADNKNRVILLTSDKTMTLKARAYGVQTQYVKKVKRSRTEQHMNPNIASQINPYRGGQDTTLKIAQKEGKDFVIKDFNSAFKSVLVISGGYEYTHGPRKLKMGDDVYIATKQADSVYFSHYEITSLSEVCNCQLIYSKRIYNRERVLRLPKKYKSFMGSFRRRHDL